MARRKTDAEFHEEVFDQVGKEYVFSEQYKGSGVKIQAMHIKCGREYYVTPADFLSGVRCPKCAYVDMGIRKRRSHEDFVKRSKRVHGDSYVVIGKYTKSSDKIKVRHADCGREYEVEANSFLMGSTCEVCSYKKRGTKTRIDPTEYVINTLLRTNNEFIPISLYKRSWEPVKYRHRGCGTEFERTPNDFLGRSTCPKCHSSKSLGELRVSKTLKRLGVIFEEEKPIGRTLRSDFYLPEYQAYIEYDGHQHFYPIEFWGGRKAFEKQKRNDAIKNKYFEFLGFPYLRIPYWNYDRVEEIVAEFIEELKQ